MKIIVACALFALLCICKVQCEILISPCLGKVSNDVVEACRKEAGLNDEVYAEAQKKVSSCGFYFDKSSEYHKFYVCVAIKQGLYDASTGEVNIEFLYQKWNFFTHGFIDKIVKSCDSQVAHVKDENERKYKTSVCHAIYAGDFPHGSKQLSIVNISPVLINQCREKVGQSEKEWCEVFTNTERNAAEGNNKALCYHYCLLEKLGFVKDLKLVKSVVKSRFDYVEDAEFERVYKKCVVEFTEKNKCEKAYEMHKCIKIEFGEYPIPSEK